MNRNRLLPVLLLTASCAAFAACGGTANNAVVNTATTTNAKAPANAAANQSAPKQPASGQSLSDPKGSIAYQFELLKAGDTEKLKACFTERQRERITPDVVEQGKKQAGEYTLDDLVASVEPGESEGKKTAKIKMKDGRTLTTLIETDGKWLADTVWFK